MCFPLNVFCILLAYHLIEEAHEKMSVYGGFAVIPYWLYVRFVLHEAVGLFDLLAQIILRKDSVGAVFLVRYQDEEAVVPQFFACLSILR